MSFLTLLRPAVLNTGLQSVMKNIGWAERRMHLLCRSYEKPNNVGNAVQKTDTMLMPLTPAMSLTAGFKVKARLKRRCKDCYFVVRDRRMHVICPTHPRHKQMALVPKEKHTWILTHATQSKIRPW